MNDPPVHRSSPSVSLLDWLSRHPEDQHRWRELVEQYGGKILSYLRQRTNDRDVAEDLLQDVYRQLCSGIRTFRRDRVHGAGKSWLFQIAGNALRRWCRRRARRQAAETKYARAKTAEQFRAFVLRTVDGAIDAELAAEAQRLALAKVRPNLREAFRLTQRQGESAPEVALRLGLTASAIMQSNHRIRRATLKIYLALKNNQCR